MNNRIAPCKECPYKDSETYECTKQPCNKWRVYERCIRISDKAIDYILELRHGKWLKYREER